MKKKTVYHAKWKIITWWQVTAFSFSSFKAAECIQVSLKSQNPKMCFSSRSYSWMFALHCVDGYLCRCLWILLKQIFAVLTEILMLRGGAMSMIPDITAWKPIPVQYSSHTTAIWKLEAFSGQTLIKDSGKGSFLCIFYILEYSMSRNELVSF